MRHALPQSARLLETPIPRGRGDGLILHAVLHHLLLREKAIEEVHQARVPWLDHGQSVPGERWAVFEERDGLVPAGVGHRVRFGLVMEMTYTVLRRMIVLLHIIPGPPSRPGQGSPGIQVVHKTMMQHNVPV